MPPLYPAGLAGAGLFILRLSVSSSLMMLSLPFRDADGIFQVSALFLTFGIVIGIWARVLALLSLIPVAIMLETGAVAPLFGALHLSISTALVLTGAGAYSLDARLFGRRRLILSDLDDTSE